MAKMGLPEEAEDPLFNKHQQLAKELNLDEVTANQAWESYQSIRVNFTLEGDDLHWLGCAIFVACRKSVTPTISRGTVKGNPVSLTCLLRYCNLSLQQFFNKIVKWADMADIHDKDFQQKIKHLEDNFVVTCNIYKEFFPMYVKVFKEPESESIKHRNRKQRPPPCTPIKVFEFTWLLFITVKGKHPSCGSDIVTSYYFLQACLDLAFRNAFLAGRRDLLNPDFNGLPPNWSMPGYQIPLEAPSIIDKLCVDKKLLADAIYIKEYTFKQCLSDLFRVGTLLGDKSNFTGLFNQENFESNFSSITKLYEQHILNEGDFDEKIFLAEYQRQIKLKNSLPINGANNASVTTPISCLGDVAVNNVIRDNASVGDVSSSQHCPNTPLTGKRYVGPKDQNETSLLQTVTQSISMLQSTLEGCSPEASENLNTIIKSCTPDPTDIIQEVVDRLGTKFVENLSRSNEISPSNIQSEQDKKKLDLGITLFYKLLENILLNEKMINKDISPLVQKTIFFECLFACSLEIIIHSYNIPKKFPWILEISEVPPSYFVRVVELIVRTKDQLSRDTVKHLSCVEETILESLTWKGRSQLWDDIATWGKDIPKFEDIALPGNMVYNNSTGAITTPNRRALLQSPRIIQSPGPSAVDTFQSPINTVRPGQSLLQNNRPTHLMVTDAEGLRKFIPIEQSPVVPTSPAPKRPRKTGSLCIIFRKFYNLAWVRMDHLCSKLCINDIDLKRKIWTVFEHSVRETTLLKDRHLDQLLMCAVYVICKVTESSSPNFAEIMKCYRDQPQANSNIYRNVLMKDDKRSNLIEFYNNVYVPGMKNFVGKFSNTQNTELDILLSPLPAVKSLLASPRHQVTKNLFIRPYESPSNPNLTGSGYSYYFNRSASKDLKDINKAINGSCMARKRILTDSTLESGIASKRINRKMQTLIEERKGHIVE